MSKLKFFGAAALIVALGVRAGVAQAGSLRDGASWKLAENTGSGLSIPAEAFSSSVSDTDASTANKGIVQVAPSLTPKKDAQDGGPIRPFSRIAIGTKTGTLGLGGQIATPITRWLNLRGGVDIFNFGYNLTSGGTNYGAALHMKSGSISADYYPFHRASFFLSPGVLIFKSTLTASMYVPAGSTFTENDVDYTSDPNDPVNGSGSILFSRTAMPKLTMGFGNMIKRRENQHWSVPFEIGAAYTGHDTIQFNLAGSACQQGICQSVNNPSIQQNVTQEQNKINEEAKRFQIYPILTTGVSYRF
jgi:hypothetical protein